MKNKFGEGITLASDSNVAAVPAGDRDNRFNDIAPLIKQIKSQSNKNELKPQR